MMYLKNVVLKTHLILQMVSKNREWLQEELNKQNILDFREVLLGYIDSNNHFNVQKKML